MVCPLSRHRTIFLSHKSLLCTEDSVSRIAQTRTDISIFIQAAVYMANLDLDIRMITVETLYAFRCSDNTHKFNIFTAMLFDKAYSLGT